MKAESFEVMFMRFRAADIGLVLTMLRDAAKDLLEYATKLQDELMLQNDAADRDRDEAIGISLCFARISASTRHPRLWDWALESAQMREMELDNDEELPSPQDIVDAQITDQLDRDQDD